MLSSLLPSVFPLGDPIIIFAVVAALILVVPFAMEKLRAPALVGLLLMGALLGPNALHVLDRDASFKLLGGVGLMFIMFIAALEIDLASFKRFGPHVVVFAIVTFSLPLLGAAPIAYYVFGYSLPVAILLASVLSSHMLLTYPMANKLGITKNRAVITAVGATMLCDTGALLVLAVIAGMGQGHSITPAFWWRLGLGIAIYVAAIFIGLPRLGRWLFRRVGEDGHVQYAFVVAAVFICAGLSHLAGLEPIIGAFLVGLALNRLIPHNGTLMNRIVFVGEAIFIPFFLLSVGMLLDARALVSGFRTWGLIVFLTAMVLVAKFLAAESTRLLLRFNKIEARVVFSLTVSQAAATLAVVQVGYNLHFFGSDVVNAALMTILVTCTLSPLVMARFGPEVAQHEAAAAEQVGPRQRILVGLRDLRTAQPVVELALLLRDAAQRQPIYLVHAAGEDESREEIAQAEKMLHDAVSLCASADVPAEISTSVDRTVGAALSRSTKELQGSHLVLDWDFAAPTGDCVLGATVDELLHANPGALVLVRNRHPLSTTRQLTLVLPPLRHDEGALADAASTVKRLAQQLGAPIAVMAEASTWAACKATVERAKPSVKLKHHAIEDWASLKQALVDRTSTSDLLVMIGSRDASSEIARGALDLAARFPDASIALVHGAQELASVKAAAPTAEPVAADRIAMSVFPETMEPAHVPKPQAAIEIEDETNSEPGTGDAADGSATPRVLN